MSDPDSPKQPKPKQRNYLIVAGVLAVISLGAIGVAIGTGGKEAIPTTFLVKKGPLDIVVIEGGNVEAIESQEVKSQVAGWEGTKILFIVEEGTFITEDDVKNQRRLVELDSSQLREKLTTNEIQFKSTQASLAEARQGYDIQINKSESEIYAAELELKFAGLELEKYLGRTVAQRVLDKIEEAEQERRDAEDLMKAEEEADQGEMAKVLVEDALNEGKESEEQSPIDVETPDASQTSVTQFSLTHLRLGHPKIDFLAFADPELLGDSESGQKIRELEDKLVLARKELGLARTELEAQERLHEKEFVTLRELENARLDVEKQDIGLESAETAKNLFLDYEFPKQAEKLTSDYLQAKRKLERTEKSALSELAQAEAKLLSSEARYNIEKARIEEYRSQVDKCIMYAERPGLVVYGGSGPNYWDAEPIKEGATVRERQAIITIPDMSTMAVKIKVHESEVKRVKVGQQARISVEAQADKQLRGKVQKVAVLPDAENRWMNPDLKVYETVVTVEGIHDWIKPGMSAEVQILVDSLQDTIYIPIQSVVPDGRDQVCFVYENGEVKRRVIETGPVTVEYIVVEEGLEPGDRVLIRPPEGSRNDEAEEERVDWESEDASEPVAEEDGEPDALDDAEPESVDPKVVVPADTDASE